MLLVYTLSHFLVDFVSVLFVLGKLPTLAPSNELFVLSIITYNFFAFFFQVPLGLLLDKLKVYKFIGIIGFSLIGICYLTDLDNILILAALVGLGNALFHLEGGVNVYRLSNRKAFLNGLFVAPGALGVFLGTTLAPSLSSTYFPILLIFLAIILLSLISKKSKKLKPNQAPLKFSKLNYFLIFSLIGVSIIVRSIGGNAINYSWKTDFLLGLFFTLSVVLGKALGGLFADKFGFIKTASLSLALSTVFLILGFSYPIFGFLGIFCFNVPMAITLTLLENSSQKIATAVGANTAFLFLGFLICLLEFAVNNVFLLIFSVSFAIFSIYFANKFYNQERKKRKWETT